MSKNCNYILVQFTFSHFSHRVHLIGIAMDRGANPQRVSTEIIIEIKQLYSGRIASRFFI